MPFSALDKVEKLVKEWLRMSRINKFVLTVSLLIFIMISAVACDLPQMVKERVYGLKQSVIDTAFAVANYC